MIGNLKTNLILLTGISAAGCAAFSGAHNNQNEELTGMLDLEIQAVRSPGFTPGSINPHYLVDLEALAWWHPNSTVIEKHPCSYQLRGRRLHLELEMDIEFNPDRVPETYSSRRLITIDGKFAERDGDFLRGPFKGSAVEESIHRSDNDFRGERTYSSREMWNGTVTGQCVVDGEVVEGIWAIPPSF